MKSLLHILTSSLITGVAGTLICKSQSQPNPIAASYPNLTTGTVNGTIAILPIPYSLARQIIPSQYGILKSSYQSLLPGFPADMYPAMLQAELDHDVGEGTTVKIPDFSRSGISYPFVDRLGDGYTAMSYNSYLLVSAQLVAQTGSDLYGEYAQLATFDPPCDAYNFISGSNNNTTTYFNAYEVTAASTSPSIGTQFTHLSAGDTFPYTLSFFKNITNQPQFGANTLICDNFIRLFNTSVSQPPYAPTKVKGNVTAVSPFFASATTFSNVYGYQIDNAFIENNFMSCDSLKGYHGTGAGD